VDGTPCSSSVDTSSFLESTIMAKTVETRLIKLEQRLPVGCATCRTWMDAVLGDEDGSRSRSEDCPSCGRRVLIRTVIIIRGVPWTAV
jgi:DNA-directed RNA polymerase subunit RPC12/RpoP